jgi:Triose-phosphate Transporter family
VCALRARRRFPVVLAQTESGNPWAICAALRYGSPARCGRVLRALSRGCEQCVVGIRARGGVACTRIRRGFASAEFTFMGRMHDAVPAPPAWARAMSDIKNLNSTAVYAWTTLISVIICVPLAAFFEGPQLPAAVDAALASHPNFYLDLASVGLLYHLYNQVRG